MHSILPLKHLLNTLLVSVIYLVYLQVFYQVVFWLCRVFQAQVHYTIVQLKKDLENISINWKSHTATSKNSSSITNPSVIELLIVYDRRPSSLDEKRNLSEAHKTARWAGEELGLRDSN